jgi:iron complex outermembrane receptor protein
MYLKRCAFATIFTVAATALFVSSFALSENLNTSEHIQEIVVTTTREVRYLNEMAESIGVISEQALRNISPSHPAEALNRIAGVHINNLGGEGHMASIRQPITTAGVYLFLEDGLPTRPTGFFNHNGLYEVNIPQSSRLEVIKGPASALYGSDAIGGVINVISKAPAVDSEMAINHDQSADGWQRSLLSTSGGDDNLAARLDFNHTQSDGFRDQAIYDRQSLTARVDSQINDRMQLKVIATYSTIDQSGVSSLELDDYQNNTQKNFYHEDIGYREVEALRLSAEMTYKISDKQLLTLTPFYRDNQMLMMPSWMVTYDPNMRDYEFTSYGALLKYRQRFLDNAVELIVGMDFDSTPSTYREEKIDVTQTDLGIYTDYSPTGELNYFFDAKQRSLSPYMQAELQLNDQWRINMGVRYDDFKVDYKNFLPADPANFSHRRPNSATIDYANTSPKFGAVYQYTNDHQAYANYRYAFRAPTVGALFRSGSSQNSTELQPVTSVSAEIGLRGQFGDDFDYELAFYEMNTEDDIVSVIRDGARLTVNAGETVHRGIELGLDYRFNHEWQLGLSLTHTDQSYKDFTYVFFSRSCFCNQQINFAGKQVGKAPENLANVRLAYSPQILPQLKAELEWDSVGEYYTDETNTQKYHGHNLVNLRLNYRVSEQFDAYLRGANLTDKLYSTYTSNQVNDPDISYRPGMPRSWFVGLRWTF